MTIDMSQFRTLDAAGNVRQMTREEVLALRPGVQVQFQPPRLTILATGEPLGVVDIQLRNGLGEPVAEARRIKLMINQGEDMHEVDLDANGSAKLQVGVVLRAGEHVVTIEDIPGPQLLIMAEV